MTGARRQATVVPVRSSGARGSRLAAAGAALLLSAGCSAQQGSIQAAAPAPLAPVVQVAEPVRLLPPPPLNAADPARDVSAELGPPPGPQDDVRPERVAAPADRYAFLVGVQDYRPPTKDTVGSAADVRAIADLLVASGWQRENIRTVTDEQATGRAVRDGLAWLADHGRDGTFSLFHYSGHVKMHGGGRESLWPIDRDWVDDRALAAAVATIGGRVWVDVAGCEAGSFEPGVPSERVLFTASSTATQKSYEQPDWGLSVWTGLVFDLATRQGGADADADGRVTMGEALRYSTYYAQAVTLGQEPHGRQTPQVAGDPVLGWTLADPPALDQTPGLTTISTTITTQASMASPPPRAIRRAASPASAPASSAVSAARWPGTTRPSVRATATIHSAYDADTHSWPMLQASPVSPSPTIADPSSTVTTVAMA